MVSRRINVFGRAGGGARVLRDLLDGSVADTVARPDGLWVMGVDLDPGENALTFRIEGSDAAAGRGARDLRAALRARTPAGASGRGRSLDRHEVRAVTIREHELRDGHLALPDEGHVAGDGAARGQPALAQRRIGRGIPRSDG